MKKLAVAFALLLVLVVPASAARLPIVAAQDWWPVYSPDSNHVAFTRVAGRTFQLLVADPGARRSVAVGASTSQLHPTWSTDGRLAYSSGGVLYVVNLDGSGKQRYAAPAKASSPAWRPGSDELAFVTTHGATNTDLWVGDRLWAKDVIGAPSWSPDGTRVAFAREGGIYLATGPGAEAEVASVTAEPGAPVFSPDGKSVAYAAEGRVYVVRADGSAKPVAVAGPFADVGPLAWGPTNDVLAYSVRGGLELSTNEPTWHSSLAVKGAVGPGASFAPGNAHSDVLVYSGPRPSCPGHLSTSTARRARSQATARSRAPPGPTSSPGPPRPATSSSRAPATTGSTRTTGTRTASTAARAATRSGRTRPTSSSTARSSTSRRVP